MTDVRLQTLIEQAWEHRAAINPQTTGDVRDAVNTALEALDAGQGPRRRKDCRRGRPEFLEGQPVAEEGGAAELPP